MTPEKMVPLHVARKAGGEEIFGQRQVCMTGEARSKKDDAV